MNTFEHVRVVAQAILNRLGHHGPPWVVLTVAEPPDAPLGQGDGLAITLTSSYSGAPHTLPEVHSLLVTLGQPIDDQDESVGAYYSLDVAEPDAIAALASQIQDHAIEATQGNPLPPCPGHGHPLSPHVVDGVAVWVCPQVPGHHREPIV